MAYGVKCPMCGKTRVISLKRKSFRCCKMQHVVGEKTIVATGYSRSKVVKPVPKAPGVGQPMIRDNVSSGEVVEGKPGAGTTDAGPCYRCGSWPCGCKEGPLLEKPKVEDKIFKIKWDDEK